jgi:hypothetical protein
MGVAKPDRRDIAVAEVRREQITSPTHVIVKMLFSRYHPFCKFTSVDATDVTSLSRFG